MSQELAENLPNLLPPEVSIQYHNQDEIQDQGTKILAVRRYQTIPLLQVPKSPIVYN